MYLIPKTSTAKTPYIYIYFVVFGWVLKKLPWKILSVVIPTELKCVTVHLLYLSNNSNDVHCYVLVMRIT
jgi:hypothetical protein